MSQGKRRRDGYVNDEDVKENLKASRNWYGKVEAAGGHSYAGPLENHNIRSKLQHDASTSAPPSLNMEQRVMAAAALQVTHSPAFPLFSLTFFYGYSQSKPLGLTCLFSLRYSCSSCTCSFCLGSTLLSLETKSYYHYYNPPNVRAPCCIGALSFLYATFLTSTLQPF